MIQQLFALSFAFIFSVFAFAQTQEKVREVRINDFRVFLVDLEKGNQFGYSFAVPYGSSDDEPKHFGRAHFYEHMYSRGSKRFPGHETLIKAISGFGYERNAATGYSYTMYYGKGHERHGIEAMTMHLASLESPELEASSISREKATVINEIIKSAPGRPSVGVFMLPFWLLPEDGHPVKGHVTGTHETLDPMSESDLRELHDRIYHAGNVSLTVFANFTNGIYTREQITEELTKILPKSSTPQQAYQPQAQAPIFAQDKILDLFNKKERAAMIVLPLAKNANLAEVRAFLDVFTGSDRNGLEDIARRKLGWATEVDASVMRAGSQQLVLISADLTLEGYKNREAFSRWILEAIENAKAKKFSEAVTQQTRSIQKEKLRRNQNNLDTLIRSYPTWMTSTGYDAQLHMNWDKAVEVYNPLSLQNGAKAILVSNKAFSFMGPDESKQELTNAFYNLKYSIRPWKDASSGLEVFDPTRVEASDVTLTRMQSVGDAVMAEQYEKSPGFSFLSVYNPKWEDRTVRLGLSFANLDALQLLSLKALVNVAEQTHKAELASISAQGISMKIDVDPNGLQIFARGNTGAEGSAIEWYLGKLKALSVNPLLLEQFRESERLSLQKTEDGFAGSASLEMMRSIFSRYESGALQRTAQIDSLSLSSIEELRKQILPKSYKSISIAGSYYPSEIVSLKMAAKAFSFDDLAIHPEESAPQFRVQGNTAFNETWQDPERKDFGSIRVIAGPPLENKKEKMALAIVARLISEQVFLQNRPLGYVHGAAATALAKIEHFVFFGQTSKQEDLVKMESVWDKELGRWQDKQITPEEFEKSRTGTISQLSADPNSSLEGLEQANAYLARHSNPFIIKEFLEILKNLKIEDSFAAVDKYLNKDAPRLTISKNPGKSEDCETMLRGRTELRARLRINR